MRVGGLIGVRDMEWGEAGNDTVDDEERIFQSVLEDQLACCNGRPVIIELYQYTIPSEFWRVISFSVKLY